MKILGIHDGHNASAAILINGEIVAAVSEERFSRAKNDWTYPHKAIEYCLKKAGINPSELDKVAIASLNSSPILQRINRPATYSVFDWLREQNEHWKPVLLENKPSDFYSRIQKEKKFQRQTYYDLSSILQENIIIDNSSEKFREIRKSHVAKHLGINAEKITFINHHACHAYYAYYASPIREEKVLILTADGFGDEENATIYLSSKDGLIQKFKTDKANLGRIYRYITLLMGMKVGEHEYKVMGLAPFAKDKYSQPVLDIFRKTLYIDGIEWRYHEKPKDHYFHFKEALEGYRFDNLAGGLQRYSEELLSHWIKNALKQFGCNKAVFSGGVAMNVKANKIMAETEGLDFFYVPPSGGDESLSIGATYYEAEQIIQNNQLSFNYIKPLKHAYLGPEFSDEEISRCLADKNIFEKYKVAKNSSPEILAGFLVDNKIIARCVGRMEFGDRALGNRSILANPKDWNNVRQINDQIKYRDFWMPFTPSMLAERADDYIINPKKLSAPFMTIAFDSTELSKRQLPAVIHPADYTTRPQMVEKEINPGYYDIIKAFERKTGFGCILNTSFNLHGEPIVCSPEDAIHTFENSELDMMQLGNFLIQR